MKIKHSDECACDKPEIKCHGDQPIEDIFKYIQIEEDKEE